MNSVSSMYWSNKLQGSQPRILRLNFSITAAVTVTDILRSPSLVTFGAIAAQSTIDNFLTNDAVTSTNEFLIAQFDATAMGADTMGVIVNMNGQCAEVYQMIARCYSASNTLVTRQCEDSATLTSSTLATEIAVGAYGNIGLKIDFGNTPDFDGLTAGLIDIEVLWRSK